MVCPKNLFSLVKIINRDCQSVLVTRTSESVHVYAAFMANIFEEHCLNSKLDIKTRCVRTWRFISTD